MVEILYEAPQWEIPQAWFLSCSFVSTYSTTMNKLMLPLLAPQLQERQWWRCSRVLLNRKFPKLGLFLAQLCLHTPPQWPSWGFLLAPQLQEKQWWRCSMVLPNGRFPKIGLFITQLVSFLLNYLCLSFSTMYTMLQAILRHLGWTGLMKSKFWMII